jgi:ribonuclease P protein component
MTETKAASWLLKRSDFLRTAKGRRLHTDLFTLQAVRSSGDMISPRFGITVTSKTGNAVERNRMKRRLRDAIRHGARKMARPSTDYVIIGRRALLSAQFDAIVHELAKSVERIKPTQLDPNSTP